jgi:hypothetical protein
MKTLTREETKKEKNKLRKENDKLREKERIREPKLEFWGTKDELRYLKTIGTHMVYSGGESRKFMLRRYAKSIEGRTDWGPIDAQVIKDYLMLELGAKI